MGAAQISIQGPGTYQFQNVWFNQNGKVQSAVMVDHEDADVFVGAGDATNSLQSLDGSIPSHAHFWQKRGRLRLYSVSMQAALGESDVRIEKASKFGAHRIIGSRSEGRSGPSVAYSTIPSRILYVPTTTSPVDVVLMASGIGADTGPRGVTNIRNNCVLAKYEGAGTLWVIGNNSYGYCGRAAMEGTSTGEVIALGNYLSSPELFKGTATRQISSLNGFDIGYWVIPNPSPTPQGRWIPNSGTQPKLTSQCRRKSLPDDSIPSYVPRPTMDVLLPDWKNVKTDYSAVGDGVADDTIPLQNAFDAMCTGAAPDLIWFPAGTYRITAKLGLNDNVIGTCHNGKPNGGWIAGSGSGSTTIQMNSGTKLGIIKSDGLVNYTFQGITFRTFQWASLDPEESVITLDRLNGSWPATQANRFYDTVFDGGWSGFATGTTGDGQQCSGQVIHGGEIKNAEYGLNSAHQNAILNGVWGTTFTNNNYSFAHVVKTGSGLSAGGNHFVLGATSIGTRTKEFLIPGSGNGTTWYIRELTSNAPNFLSTANTVTPWLVTFEKSSLTPTGAVTYLFDQAASGGITFAHSNATRAGVRVGQTGGAQQDYFLKINSSIGDWSSAVAPAPDGQLDSWD
jgi:hypothetical protein